MPSPDEDGDGALSVLSESEAELLQISAQIDTALAEIMILLASTKLRGAKIICQALNFSSSCNEAMHRWIAYNRGDSSELGSRSDNGARPSVAALLSTFLGQLERLRTAVVFSSQNSNFLWWISTRQGELGIENYLVLAFPGQSLDFKIEPVGGLIGVVEDLRTVLSPTEEQRECLRRIRLIIVPLKDGTSTKWHPLTLGHELAHLLITTDYVQNWLTTLDTATVDGDFARMVVQSAKSSLDNPRFHPKHYYLSTLNHLCETGCDAVAWGYYGGGAISALEANLGIHSTAVATQSHPDPELRLKTLRGQPLPSIGEDSAGEGHTDELLVMARRAYCALAPSFLEHVVAMVSSRVAGSIGETIGETIREDASKVLLDGDIPNSMSWKDCPVKSASTIETGLVRASWAARLALYRKYSESEGHEQFGQCLRAVTEHTEQAVDFLQFYWRFMEGANDIYGDGSKVQYPVNVLHVTRNGVRVAADEPGRPSCDVRLGHFFIVFKRNRIAYFNPYSSGLDSQNIQEEVEIGWGDSFTLHPGEMVLGVTVESLVMEPDCSAQVLSRSSLGRLGLLSATAVQVQPGFRGCLTLELVNLASVPIQLVPGQRIAQIVPVASCGEADHESDKYQHQGRRPRFSAIQNDPDIKVLARMREGMQNE